MARPYIITYDISDDRLRRRMARLLEGFGERVQRSAFECRLRESERRALENAIVTLLGDTPEIIDPPIPGLPGMSVRMYALAAQTEVIEFGEIHEIPLHEWLIL